jgi:hypothetical protein
MVWYVLLRPLFTMHDLGYYIQINTIAQRKGQKLTDSIRAVVEIGIMQHGAAAISVTFEHSPDCICCVFGHLMSRKHPVAYAYYANCRVSLKSANRANSANEALKALTKR